MDQRETDRRKKLLALIDVGEELGLEFGALDKPVVSGSDARVHYVDQASTEDLRSRYADDPNVAVEKIVAVTHVWRGDDLPGIVGRTACYDYVLASHVIEHIPDPLGWFEQLAAVLRPGGILSLAIPDKRYTFDYFREISPPAALLDGYWERRRAPTPSQVFDLYAHAVHVSAADAWQRRFGPGELPSWNPLGEAVAKAERARREYVDCHCTVWTPEALLRCLRLFTELDLFSFDPVLFHDTPRYDLEFFIALRNDPSAPKAKRLANFDAHIARCANGSVPAEPMQTTPSIETAPSIQTTQMMSELSATRTLLRSRSATLRHLVDLVRRKALDVRRT